MPSQHIPSEKQQETSHNYDGDPRWQKTPLTPAQTLVYDVRLETYRRELGAMLEINERPASTLVPQNAALTPSASFVRAADAASNPIEKQRFASLEENFGWLRYLRLQQYQQHAYDTGDSAKCRWIHCSSKFPDYLRGFLWALSDDISTVSASLQMMDNAIERQTRFSKHGKYFAPFSQSLCPNAGAQREAYPMLIAVPFFDWSVLGTPPPLRFQVDRREGYHSAKSSSHPLRSVLQYFYRLEDTADRERDQVFAKHKPWSTNRELDLKVRRWYGHYPSALNVDELWILVIDAEHIVTFSSNQTWKSRWPPLQLTSRISDIAFRGIRNNYFASENDQEYTAMTHAIACLSGAVGLMHRNFWADLVLPATDRYAGHLSHLQYRLHRAPSTKLVMDLIACQEELNIVIQITQQQLDMMSDLQTRLEDKKTDPGEAHSPASRRRMSVGLEGPYYNDFGTTAHRMPHRATYRQLSSSNLSDPMAQLLDNLSRELTDLRELRDNTDRLVTRTIQLVNIRLEDHGKAILVFTVVTIVFLPLNFVSSFFGMNFVGIRNTDQTQWLFWPVALCVTAGVVGASIFMAFSGSSILEKLLMWRDTRREQTLSTTTVLKQAASGEPGFVVHGVAKEQRFSPYP